MSVCVYMYVTTGGNDRSRSEYVGSGVTEQAEVHKVKDQDRTDSINNIEANKSEINII